jgi:pyruvate formate lyase activating enzyme
VVFDISRGCFEDGPGLRTTVFLKGCNLDCPWCHNLEGKRFEPETAFDASRCIGCGGCENGSVEDCPPMARRIVGREYSVDELVEAVLQDADFFAGTGGGATLSGGEPMAQPEFALALARALREAGVHVALETSGFFAKRLAPRVAEHFDLVLLDLKHVDRAKCRRVLGKDYAPRALANLEALLEVGTEVQIRITLAPGFNDSDADLEAMAKRLAPLRESPRATVRVQPFHRLATSKAPLYGTSYAYAGFPPTSAARLELAERCFA